MQAEAYQLMADLESEHWWYRGRRALVRRMLERLEPPPVARLLDIGAGTGGNLGLLAEFGTAFGMEPSPLGRELGDWRGRLVRGRAGRLPFASGSFEVLTILDVLEHLHDELQALDECRRLLRPDGGLVIHVPAYRMLWGHEDVVSDHLRRYRASEIRRLLEASGFEIVHLGYAFTLLFPMIATVKIGKRLLLSGDEVRPDVAALPPSLVNEALAAIVESEAEVAATARLPFGASIIASARRQ